MLITQKKQYAVRAIYELAKWQGQGPVKAAQISEAQAIPKRFLESILNRLKHAGLVAAKRGYYGGFQLKRPPEEITVGDIFHALDDVDEATICVSCISNSDCPFYGACAFLSVWNEMQTAIDNICHNTTIQKLLDDNPADKPIPGKD